MHATHKHATPPGTARPSGARVRCKSKWHGKAVGDGATHVADSNTGSPHTIGFGSLSRRASRFSCVLGSESEGSLGTWSWIMKRKLAIIETKSAVNLFLSSISKRVLAHRTTKLTHLSLRLFSPISVALYLASLSNCFRMIRHETSLIGRA
jgi:hypothetical protein